MKRCISFVLVLMTLCVCLFPAAQAEGIQPRNSNYFNNYGTTLSNHGNG